MPVFVGNKFIQGAYLNGKQYDTAYIGDNKVGFKIPPGEAIYTTPGTYQWVCPAGVFLVSAVCVGAGSRGSGSATFSNTFGGGGGGLGWKNNIPVVPGQSYTVQVGAGTSYNPNDSYFIDDTTVCGRAASNRVGGGYVGDGGGNGGDGGEGSASLSIESGAGGAGGYSGDGGRGANDALSYTESTGGGGTGGFYTNATDGTTKWSGGGGGVGLFGEGPINKGDGYNPPSSVPGASGSSGNTGTSFRMQAGVGYETPENLTIGGGGSALGHYNSYYISTNTQYGGDGAVRILWGTDKSFPNQANAYAIPNSGYTFTQDFGSNWQKYYWDFFTNIPSSLQIYPIKIANDIDKGKDVLYYYKYFINTNSTRRGIPAYTGVTLFTPYSTLSTKTLTFDYKIVGISNLRVFVDGSQKPITTNINSWYTETIEITGTGVHRIYFELYVTNGVDVDGYLCLSDISIQIN